MKTDAEKKAAAARRAREYRDRKRKQADAAPCAEAAEPVKGDAPAAAAAGSIRVDVDVALAAMKWIERSDGAAVALARLSAGRLDSMVAQKDPKLDSRIQGEQQVLIRILRELGGTPTIRMQHEMRSMRLAPNVPEVPDEPSSDSESKRSNVTQLQRPARRNR